MNKNLNFKELWKSQSATQPSYEELLSKISKFKQSNVRKLVLSLFTLLATSILILWIWAAYQPEMLTTKLGIVLTILAMVIFGTSNSRQYSILKELDRKQNSADYIKSFTALKRKQQYLQTTMLSLYFILLSIGICLYMIEPTWRMSVVGKLSAYGLTLVWIAFSWFYLRPQSIKKQQKKLDYLIVKLEDVERQIEE